MREFQNPAAPQKTSGKQHFVALRKGQKSSLACSTSDAVAVSGDFHGNIIRWNLNDLSPVAKIHDGRGIVHCDAIAPGSREYAVGVKNFITIRNMNNDEILVDSKMIEGNAENMTFSSDGTLLLCGLYKVAVLLNMNDGSERTRFCGHVGSLPKILAVAISNDNRLVVTAGNDRSVRLWDARTGLPLARLDGHTKSVTFVCLIDNEHLLSSDDEDTIIWNMRSRIQLFRLRGITVGPSDLVWVP